MKLSTKTRYGLRILLQIALDTEGRSGASVKGKNIAEKQEISEAYLEQIMIPMKGRALVRTVRGCHGGYALNRLPEEITLLDIIELLEGPLSLVNCTGKSGDCQRASRCAASRIWDELSKAIRKAAAAITLKSLVDETKEKGNPEYVI